MWLYDNLIQRPVRIHRLSWDYWFELTKADGLLDEGEGPQLNEHGHLYYVQFGDDGEQVFPMSVGFMSCDDATEWAESRVPAPIRWSDQK
jgi:hypothetical protein